MTALPPLTEPLTDGVVSLRRFTLDDVAAVTMACQDPEIPRWTAGTSTAAQVDLQFGASDSR